MRTLLLLVVAGCATSRPAVPAPSEAPLASTLEGAVFSLAVHAQPGLVGDAELVTPLLEQRLVAKGARVDASADQRLELTIREGSHEVAEAQLECVTIEATLGSVKAPFLPSRPLGSKRCERPEGGVSGPNDALGAIIAATALAIDASNGEWARRRAAARAAALDRALDELLTKLALASPAR